MPGEQSIINHNEDEEMGEEEGEEKEERQERRKKENKMEKKGGGGRIESKERLMGRNQAEDVTPPYSPSSQPPFVAFPKYWE